MRLRSHIRAVLLLFAVLLLQVQLAAAALIDCAHVGPEQASACPYHATGEARSDPAPLPDCQQCTLRLLLCAQPLDLCPVPRAQPVVAGPPLVPAKTGHFYRHDPETRGRPPNG